MPLVAPLARRGTEVLLEDAAEMGEVVETPGEGNVADVPCRSRRIGQVAFAALEALGLEVSHQDEPGKTAWRYVTLPTDCIPSSLRPSEPEVARLTTRLNEHLTRALTGGKSAATPPSLVAASAPPVIARSGGNPSCRSRAEACSDS